MFLTNKDNILKNFEVSVKRFKNTKVTTSLSLEVIMGENLRIQISKSFVILMDTPITSQLQNLFNKMVVLNEKIKLFKTWLEP